jgi:hypothetical protein
VSFPFTSAATIRGPITSTATVRPGNAGRKGMKRCGSS